MTPTPVRLFQRQTAPRSNTLQPDLTKQRYGAGACTFVLYAPVPLAFMSARRAIRPLRAAGGRASCLEFSREKVINSAHNGGVTWLDLDCVEERYLLAGAADGSVAAYDVQACPQRTRVQAAEQAACSDACPAAAHPTPASARGKHRAHSAARLHSLACLRSSEPPPPPILQDACLLKGSVAFPCKQLQGLIGAIGACDAAQHGVGPRAARARPRRARARPPSSARLSQDALRALTIICRTRCEP